MKCRKRDILIFLFLIHFLFYAVSPICYADDQLSEGGTIICRPGVGIKNGFFTWELIFSKFIYHNASSGSLPTIQFIIKKARAILESNDITKILHGNFILKIKLFTVFIVQLWLAFIQIPSLSHVDFYPFFSGLSPPPG